MCDLLNAIIANSKPNSYLAGGLTSTPKQIVAPNDRRVALIMSSVNGNVVFTSGKDVSQVPFGFDISTQNGVQNSLSLTVLLHGGLVRQEWWGSVVGGGGAIFVQEAIADCDYFFIIDAWMKRRMRELQ